MAPSLAAKAGVPPSSVTLNHLYYGDNLDVLRRHIASESVDLVYLDPPFNSNRSYNVLFKEKSGTESHAQIEAFGDTWTWSYETEVLYQDLVTNSSVRVADALEAMRKLLGDNDVLAYLVMMATRLVELHRVLRATGSLYLHCDPTASHYLKILLDAIFGPHRFRNEIIWKRTAAHGSAHRFGPVHDVLLFYTKTDNYTWNQQYGVYSDAYIQHKFSKEDPDGRRFQDVLLTGPGVRKGDSGLPWREHNPTDGGRHWAIPSFLVTHGIVSASGTTQARLDELDEKGRIYWTRTGNPRVKYYLEDAQGMPQQDVWTDISPVNSQAAERLGYPTQKPLVLLERLIASSSNKGDLVLDPFAGCGTAIDAAQNLARRWSGIDITTLAVDLIDARLRHTYSESIRTTYDIVGIPKDLAGATALFAKSPFEFERWCVMLVDGQPNEKQVGDRGIDGVIRIPTNSKGGSAKVLISVKGGASNPGHVRDLIGTVESQRAAMGIFICLREPTRGMLEAAGHSRSYTYPVTNRAYPKVQILTVAELLDGKRPDMPTSLDPYFHEQRRLVPEQRRRPPR